MNNDNILVSIGIPIYNAEKYLHDTIQSVINQSYTNWELILVDDGSTDDSLVIANAFEDSRIRIISDGTNKGLVYRLNQLSNIARGVYYARMDADDIMHPERIVRQVKILEFFPEIDVLGTNAYSINENNLVTGIRLQYSNCERLRKVQGFIHPTVMAKTSWFLANPYDANAIRIEDTELWYRTRMKYNFQILVEPLLFYREFGEDYYRKYFNGFKAMIYVLKKYNYNPALSLTSAKYFLTGMVYYIFSKLKIENFLIQRRNQVKIMNLPIQNILDDI
ncbi:glycosyltransferase family 2 protein [Flavobacterium faecale]|uniref:glycosyltransferase family 2 protein n=1 Tax=Flavobacterium faecale TaxID=1355330 RepID=UPI003AAC6D02